ncbi:MAG: helix-hairpin-helix domain-containing protein [Butyrivibrio sp.]|nr:helix-hairpin-helix domain-containing protein [Butyrivibrio sp.]
MRKKIIILIAFMMLLSGCTCAGSELILTEDALEVQENAAFLSSNEEASVPKENEVKVVPKICVYVCGAVNSPGVYELEEGSRVIDAVTKAGGLLSEADETYVNLAAVLEDGVKLVIPSKEEIAKAQSGQSAEPVNTGGDDIISKSLYGFDSAASDGKGLVNINTASSEELKSLPGIGEGIAGRIVRYRDENGRFSCIEDIMKISGIKEKLFDKIKDSITV